MIYKKIPKRKNNLRKMNKTIVFTRKKKAMFKKIFMNFTKAQDSLFLSWSTDMLSTGQFLILLLKMATS